MLDRIINMIDSALSHMSVTFALAVALTVCAMPMLLTCYAYVVRGW